MFEQHQQILTLAAERKLPAQIDGTSGIDLEVFIELHEAGYIDAIDASTLSAPAYVRPKITLAGRHYLKELLSKAGEAAVSNQPSIRLFISHSSRDEDLVALLIDLIRAALPLRAEQIRCTSVDGYRLPGGADIHAQLRAEVHEADAFVGLISAESVKSLPVVFELGARWGAGKPLVPLLAPRADAGLMRGPLAVLNALRVDKRPQLLQFVDELADSLGLTPAKPATYDAKIEAILSAAVAAPTPGNDRDLGKSKAQTLSDEEVEILQLVSTSEYRFTAENVAERRNSKVQRAQYYLDRLVEHEYLHDRLSVGRPALYGLTEKGRAYLVENDKI